jgi:hypothetical protein
MNNMIDKIEAEGGELILRSKEGYIAIIPSKYRLEVLDMIKEGCEGCLNNLISTLPKLYPNYNTKVTDDPEILNNNPEEFEFTEDTENLFDDNVLNTVSLIGIKENKRDTNLNIRKQNNIEVL